MREPVANGLRAGGDRNRGAIAFVLEPDAFSRLALNVSSSQDELGQVLELAMVKPRPASPVRVLVVKVKFCLWPGFCLAKVSHYQLALRQDMFCVFRFRSQQWPLLGQDQYA